MKPNQYKFLYFFVVVFYCLILSQFGMENLDTGYMSSFSWRIINGQIVYQDFIYKFPPVTIYLHAFFMKILPVCGQFYFFRVITYLFFSVQVFFVVSGFYNFYDFSNVRINKWALMCFCFVVSILNFPPYPWPTTDGLFFMSFAFWIISIYKRPSQIKLFFIALFCLLSALSKQSFYLIPFIFAIWIFLSYDKKSFFSFVIYEVLLFLLFIKIIVSITTWKNFTSQINGELRLFDLYFVGIHNYIFIPIIPFLIVTSLVVFGGLLYCKVTKQKISMLLPLLKWFSFVLISIAIVFCFFKKIEISSRIAFDACVCSLFYSFFYLKRTIQFLAPIFILLIVAWSVSISLGCQYPFLFSSGIILSYIILNYDLVPIKSKYFVFIFLVVGLIAFSYNFKPYREANVFKLNYSLEGISPKLKYIKTSKENYEKYCDLKGLKKKYGENFIVAPNLPMTNYLFDDESELPIDWIIDTEINRQYNRLKKLVSDKKNYIFLEKSYLNHEDAIESTPKQYSGVSWFVYTNLKKIDETNYFIVYNTLK